MAIDQGAVSVGTSATALNTAEGSDLSLLLHNSGSASVFLGASDVTTSDGVPLAAGEKVAVNALKPGEVLYGIVASGTNEVRVLRQGVG